MSLEAFAVRRGVTTCMIILGLVIMGGVGMLLLRIDALPDIEPPVISVITVYPGATAVDVETEVTKRLEDKLSSVMDLDTMTSKSKDLLSLITLEFDWKANLDEAANDVREFIGVVRRDLPDDIEEPLIVKFNSANFPILVAMISANESYNDLYRIVDKQIVDSLRRVPGVGEVDMRGGRERQINVYIDRVQLERLNITPGEIERILARENLNVPAGELKRGFTQLNVRVPGRFQAVEDIRAVVIGVHKGTLIHLGDIATVEDGFVEPTQHVWGDGRPAMVLLIRKQSGRNTPDVCDKARAALAEIQKRLPKDVKINVLVDNAEMIRDNIANLRSSLLTGGALVIVVTWLFLLRVRSSLIIALTIPVSLISVFFGMYVFGYTINMISLVSLTIAVGMVVDNAIVVLESITRHMEIEKDRREAAISGTREVALAIFASMLTTVVVFMPLIFTTGITGIIFKQLAIIVSLTLAMSWLVSVMLTPLLASRLLSAHKPGANRLERLGQRLLHAYDRVEDAYGALLGWALHRKKTTIGIALALFIGSLPLMGLIGSEFMPESDSGELSVTTELDENARLEHTARLAPLLNAFMETNVPERRGTFVIVGQSTEGMASAAGRREGPNILQCTAKLVRLDERTRSSKEIAASIRAFLARQPGIKRLSVSTQSFMQRLLTGSSSKPISVEVQGPDIELLSSVATNLQAGMERIPGCVDVTVVKPEYRRETWVVPDRQRAAALGVTVEGLATTVRSLFYGAEPTEYLDAGDNFEIHLRLPRDERVSAEDILNITVPSVVPGAPPIKLANVARVEEHPGPTEVERKNRERIVRVEADVLGRSSGQVVEDIRRLLPSLGIPLGVTVAFGGDMEEQEEAFGQLIVLLLIGVVLVYMVMAGQFESFLDPFVVMFSVPFAFTGAIWLVLITGNRLNLMSFIGVIMLMGIVVNNAIVLVDYTNQLREGGMGMDAAIGKACVTRLRPVLMTTLTTVFGLVPMAFSTGEGAEAWRPLGATVIGGLTVSTLVTLVLVPVMYALFERARHTGSAKEA